MADEELSDEEKMAAEMAAMAEEGGDAAEGGEMVGEDGKTLSQDEIDSLLGFDDADGNGKTGIHALLDKALLSFDRLPMLEVVFDRFVRTLSTSLRNFTSENVDVGIDSITSMRFEDYLNSIPLPTMLIIYQAIEWENYGLIMIDSSLTYSMVDVLFGGGRTHRAVKIEGRPFTTIEQDVVKSLSSVMLDDMSAAFNPLTPATFRVERLESNPRFATITRPSNAVIVISLRIDMDERGGKAEIMIPYATLEPVKELLVQMFTGESFGNDAAWEDHFMSEVKNTRIDVEATLKEKLLTIKEVAGLKVGSTIVMNNAPEDEIPLKCEGIKMFSGKLGSSGRNLAIRVNNVFNRIAEDEII